MRHVKSSTESFAQDKSATPPEPSKAMEQLARTLSPSYIVAERSTRSQTNIAEHYKSAFARFGDLSIRTGTEMTSQHQPWYLGMAFLFILPLAVGGYDVDNKPRWRRLEKTEGPTHSTRLDSWLPRRKG